MNLDAQKQQIPQVLPPASSAADHLAAVSKKDEKKTKSKLRRAFSFGSASELRRASAQNNLEKTAAETSKANKRNSKYEDEMEPEEAKIARDQEAGGLGREHLFWTRKIFHRLNGQLVRVLDCILSIDHAEEDG